MCFEKLQDYQKISFTLVLYISFGFMVKSGSVITFIKQVIAELKKVTWPTRDEVIRLTSVVIIISCIVGVYLAVVDFGFTKLLESII